MPGLGYRDHQGAPDQPSAGDAFASEIEALAGVRTRDLALPPDIMAAYLAQTWRSRRKMNLGWMVWAAAVNILCSLFSPFVTPHDALAALIAGRIVVTGALLAGALAIATARRPGSDGLVTIAACLGVIGGSLLMAMQVEPQIAERYLVQATFVCGTAVAVSSIAWRDTLLLAGIVTAALASSVALTAQETLSPFQSVQMAVFYGAGLAGLVLARRSMNKVLYRVFVLGVNDRLKMNVIERHNDTLHAIARTDQLTQVSNRRHFDEMFGALTLRPGGRVAMFMIDIDHFKRLNDALGHQAGDECLKAVAGIIRFELRNGRDFLARFGGEEFVAVLPNVDAETALTIAERIRRAIEERGMPNPAAEQQIVTVSIGVSVSPPLRLDVMVAKADAALYDAKSGGRNAIRLATEAARRVA